MTTRYRYRLNVDCDKIDMSHHFVWVTMFKFESVMIQIFHGTIRKIDHERKHVRLLTIVEIVSTCVSGQSETFQKKVYTGRNERH